MRTKQREVIGDRAELEKEEDGKKRQSSIISKLSRVQVQETNQIINYQMAESEKTEIYQSAKEAQLSKIFFTSLMFLDPEFTSSVNLMITENSIYFQTLKANSHIFQISHTIPTTFQVIKTKSPPRLPKDRPPSSPSQSTNSNAQSPGIVFSRQGCESLIFYTSNLLDLDRWEILLQKNFIQFNFHDYYKAERRLGKGSFASVYLGMNKYTGAKKAVKAFAKPSSKQSTSRAALFNQISLTRKLNHPNLVQMCGVYESQNSIYVVMNYIEGHFLAPKKPSGARYNESERKQIMRDILEGLAELSRLGIVHRDLKPENIIIGEASEETPTTSTTSMGSFSVPQSQPSSTGEKRLTATIIDFGLATLSESTNNLFIRCGTPGYVAPEIINIKDTQSKKHRFDPSSDIFSAGCLFYELAVGRGAFQALKEADRVKMNCDCNLNLSDEFFEGESKGGNLQEADLIRRMLQKEPSLRISAQEALRHPFFSGQKVIFPFWPKPLMKQNGLKPKMINREEAEVRFMNSSAPNGPVSSPEKARERSQAKAFEASPQQRRKAIDLSLKTEQSDNLARPPIPKPMTIKI